MGKRVLLFAVVSLVAIISLTGCIKRIEKQTTIDIPEYCPMNEGDYRLYDNFFGKAIVTRTIGNLATVTHYDSAGQIINWEDYIIKSTGVFQKNIVNATMFNSLHFEPSIPYSPWTNIVGDTLLINSIEIRNDTLNTHHRVRVEYKIVGVDSITVPAGEFTDCIKIEVTYTTLDATPFHTYDGTSYFWFAPGIGLTRYSSMGQTAELLEAEINGTKYPQ